MNRATHRFDAVLRARRAEEEIARARLAGANRELRRGRAVLARESERYRSQAAPAGACAVQELLAGRQAVEHVAASVAAARSAVDLAEEQAARCRAGWSLAAQRVTALERVVERRRQEWLAELQRREDLAVDDMVTSRRAGGVGT